MSVHAEEHQGSSVEIPKRVTRFLIVLGIVTLSLGVWGIFGIGPKGAHCIIDLESTPTRLYRLIALFEFSEVNVRIGECYTGLPIELARFTGPIATIVLLIRVLIEVLKEPVERLRLRRFSDHLVVVGFGDKGQVRAIEAAKKKGAQVVAIDKGPDEASRTVAKDHEIVLITGDALANDEKQHRSPLSKVRLHHCARVVVATGDDSRNLSIAQVIAERVRKAPARGCEIEVSLSAPLIRRALGSGTDDGLIDAFSIDDSAAYWLCDSARFFAIADLLGQNCIHVLMLGFDRLGASIVAQILRSAQIADLRVTKVSIVTADIAAARALLVQSYPGIEDVADIVYIAAEPHAVPLNVQLIAEVEASDPITAIVVLGDRGADTLPLALAVRDASRRANRWKAPIFFGIERAAALLDFSHPLGEELRFSNVLHPFEISARLCTRAYATQRNQIARELHEGYQRAFTQMQAAGLKPSSGNEATVLWDKLPRTYRQANRRAADHLAAKLLSAGCVVPHGRPCVSGNLDLLADEGILEHLAELEHRVWAIDRRLDGWLPGAVRDDSRRIHDCLVPYGALSEATKELDRAQIRELNGTIIPSLTTKSGPGKPLVRFDLWVGLIGARSLSRAEAEWVKDALMKTLLPRLLDAHPEHAITLLSPLAPGADLVATKAMLAGLASHNVQHRLLVTEAVPVKDVVDQFEAHWHNGAIGDLELPAHQLTWPQVRSALVASITNVPCERILELDHVAPGASQETCNAGYQRQNAYIVQRAHVVAAVVKPPTSDSTGGTGEAIAWRRDRSIMAEPIPQYRRRPNHAAAGFPGMIILDTVNRKICDERADT